MARPRKHVDLVEIIGRRWSGQSFPEIARGMRLGYGTVVRAYRHATEVLQAVQNPTAARLGGVTKGKDAELLRDWVSDPPLDVCRQELAVGSGHQEVQGVNDLGNSL